MTHHRPFPGDPAHPSPTTDTHAFWTGKTLADAGALPRIVDLMAKLDVEPREPSGEALRVRLEVPADGSEKDAAKFVQRLSGIIQIHSVASTRTTIRVDAIHHRDRLV